MSESNENGAAETQAGQQQGQAQSPGVLSKLSNTFQAIKMPWNKDEQLGAAPASGTAEDAQQPQPNEPAPAAGPSDGSQTSPSVFSATMSKVSNTFSNIQMPWTNKDAASGIAAPAEPNAAPAPSSPPPNDSNVLSGAFSKVTNTISSMQMPWSNKGDPAKADAVNDGQISAAAPVTPSDVQPSSSPKTGPEGNVLSSTLSKVSNTFSNMQMPWNKQQSEPTGLPNASPPASEPPSAPTNGSETSPLNKVTGFFTSVFNKSGAPQAASQTQAADANANVADGAAEAEVKTE